MCVCACVHTRVGLPRGGWLHGGHFRQYTAQVCRSTALVPEGPVVLWVTVGVLNQDVCSTPLN